MAASNQQSDEQENSELVEQANSEEEPLVVLSTPPENSDNASQDTVQSEDRDTPLLTTVPESPPAVDTSAQDMDTVAMGDDNTSAWDMDTSTTDDTSVPDVNTGTVVDDTNAKDIDPGTCDDTSAQDMDITGDDTNAKIIDPSTTDDVISPEIDPGTANDDTSSTGQNLSSITSVLDTQPFEPYNTSQDDDTGQDQSVGDEAEGVANKGKDEEEVQLNVVDTSDDVMDIDDDDTQDLHMGTTSGLGANEAPSILDTIVHDHSYVGPSHDDTGLNLDGMEPALSTNGTHGDTVPLFEPSLTSGHIDDSSSHVDTPSQQDLFSSTGSVSEVAPTRANSLNFSADFPSLVPEKFVLDQAVLPALQDEDLALTRAKADSNDARVKDTDSADDMETEIADTIAGTEADSVGTRNDTEADSRIDDTEADSSGTRADDTEAGSVDTRADDTGTGLVDTRADDTEAGSIDTRADDTGAGSVDTRADDTEASSIDTEAGSVDTRADDTEAGSIDTRADDTGAGSVDTRADDTEAGSIDTRADDTEADQKVEAKSIAPDQQALDNNLLHIPTTDTIQQAIDLMCLLKDPSIMAQVDQNTLHKLIHTASTCITAFLEHQN